MKTEFLIHPGQTFGRLTILERSGSKISRGVRTREYPVYKCRCNFCGAVSLKSEPMLRYHTTDGGCRACRIVKDRAGEVYGMITLLKYAGNATSGRTAWLGRCECGTEKVFRLDSLTEGSTTSCGCRVLTRDGDSHGEHYSHWAQINYRCSAGCKSPYTREAYYDRGIRVCERWSNTKDGFQNFVKDMGPKPSPDHSIDRKDNDGDYTPKNCRWATAVEQRANQRKLVLPQFSDAQILKEAKRRGLKL